MNLVRRLLIGALAAAPAIAAAQGRKLSVPYTLDSLPNGLTVIVHEDHAVPIVTVNIWYHVGSSDEKPGRTGFAHLFEHLMFMGSEHAEYPTFDRLLEAAGANNNASTNNDVTDYYESGPSSALPLMLWLDADRMGWLLPTMDKPKVDLQRDVVKNERRQSVENRPYGLVEDHLPQLAYPAGHPYSWSVIGSMADLSAASVEDVKDFFRRDYAPNKRDARCRGRCKKRGRPRDGEEIFLRDPTRARHHAPRSRTLHRTRHCRNIAGSRPAATTPAHLAHREGVASG